MSDNLIKYLVQVPQDLLEGDYEVEAYELTVKCKNCKNEFSMHISYDFEDTAVFRCLCCGKEKWVPTYGDYGLTGFKKYIAQKYNIKDISLMKLPELSGLYDATFESYCELCECGGRFKRSIELICLKCGLTDVEVTNSGSQFWRDNMDLLKLIKVEWLRYYMHPF